MCATFVLIYCTCINSLSKWYRTVFAESNEQGVDFFLEEYIISLSVFGGSVLITAYAAYRVLKHYREANDEVDEYLRRSKRPKEVESVP